MTRFSLYSLLLLAISLSLPKLALAEAIQCEPDPGTNMLVKYSDSVLCVFEGASDVDVYRFVGNAGDLPFIQVVSPSAAIKLYDPNGQLLDSAHFAGTVDIDNVVLAEDGIHTIVVEAHPNADNWDYSLELPCVAGRCAESTPLPALGYRAVEPCRIVDTRRDNLGGAWGLTTGEIRSFKIAPAGADLSGYGGNAQGCGIPNGAASIYVNFTAVGPQHGGYLRVWAWPKVEPTATVFAWDSGSGATNALPVPMCQEANCTEDINVKIFAQQPVDLVIDVLGYFTE